MQTEKQNRRVEIVVLKYKQPNVEAECAKRIIENTEWPFKLNFYDTRGIDPNFSKIWNQLIKESTCDYVVIMDSDVYVCKGWLDNIMGVIDKSDVAVAMPASPTGAMIQRTQNKGIIEIDNFAPVCALYRKDIFEKVGWFDEDFHVFGQDREWCNRINYLGYKAMLDTEHYCDHLGSISTDEASKSGEINKVQELQQADQLNKEKELTREKDYGHLRINV